MNGSVWLPLSVAALVLIFSFGRWFAFRRFNDWRFVAALILLAALLVLSHPGGAPGSELDVAMPPNEYIHPFAGKVVVMELPHKAGAPLLSLSHHDGGVCAIWLPRIGDPDITEELYRCLAVIEVANCNGATDVNTPAVKARASVGEQARYGRTCSQGHWDGAFDRVHLAAAGH